MNQQQSKQQQQQQQQQQPKQTKDPYAILNVARNANFETLQRSYKQLSKSFHPDKQPPGVRREAAQEVFIEFKNACKFLCISSFIKNICLYM